MKRVGMLLGALTVSVMLVGCGSIEEVETQDYPRSFDMVSEDYLDRMETQKIRDKDTGCYFVVARTATGTSMVQMFVEKNGVSVPHCEEKEGH